MLPLLLLSVLVLCFCPAVVKALVGADSRKPVPYAEKTLAGSLTSVTPLVQVRGAGQSMAPT